MKSSFWAARAVLKPPRLGRLSLRPTPPWLVINTNTEAKPNPRRRRRSRRTILKISLDHSRLHFPTTPIPPQDTLRLQAPAIHPRRRNRPTIPPNPTTLLLMRTPPSISDTQRLPV